MIQQMTTKDELSSSITNRYGLKEKIHEIHNFIRNSGAGYGFTALKLFNLLYGLQRIEQFNLLDKFNLKRPQCEFSYLYKLAISNETGKDEKIYELLTIDILDSINESAIKSILFYEIPKTVVANVYTQLIIEIQSIANIEKTCNVLLSGKIYEYFIGRDRTAISELGAYFTDRWITKFIFDKLKINKSGTMIDPFGGSGGFTTEYINYINRVNPDIDWSKEINNIYHYDINEDVIKSAMLELFCLTNGNTIADSNVKVENSFKNEFSNKKFNYIITNPPYGSTSNKTQDKIKRDKIKNYIKELLKQETDKDIIIRRNKQLKEIEELNKIDKIRNDKMQVNKDNCSRRIRAFCRNYNLDAKDKEACSLILLMDLLEVDSICCGVLKEGVFFDSKYSKLREVLINNFNVSDVISVPADQFENTTTKTSIIIFKNTEEKTTEITFSELIVNKFQDDKFEEDENGNIIISEYKDDIHSTSNPIISNVSINEIREKSYSLNYKDYDKKELVCGDDYKIVKLGDICEYLPKSKRPASFASEDGIYNFYTSSEVIKKCNEADYKNNASIIIGTNGNISFHLEKNNFSSSLCTIVLTNKYTYNINYIYYILLIIKNYIINNSNGSIIKFITKELLSNIQIPIPKTEDKLNEIVNKISIPFDRKKENENKLKELTETIKNKIIHITENEECEEVEFSKIFDIKTGKLNSKDIIKNGKYPYYNSSINNPIGRTNKLSFIGKKYIIMIRCGGNSKNKISNNHALGQVYLINKDIGANEGLYQLNIINNYNVDYLYYFLKLKTQYLQENANYSTGIGNLHKEKLRTMIIKIPKDKLLITALEPLFNEVEKLEELIENDEKLFKEYLEELAKDAIISNNTSKIINNDELEEAEEKQSIKEEKELSKMTIQELKNKCKELNIKGYSKFKKEELIDIINKQ
jgi:type I restriction enzyme S subunit